MRRLSLLDPLAIVAGTTIGSGIFIVSSAIAGAVRSPALLLLVRIAAFVSQLNDASVPSFALMIQAVWASALALSGDFGGLLDYLGAAESLFGMLTTAAVFVMRFKRPAPHRPYRACGAIHTYKLCIWLNRRLSCWI